MHLDVAVVREVTRWSKLVRSSNLHFARLTLINVHRREASPGRPLHRQVVAGSFLGKVGASNFWFIFTVVKKTCFEQKNARSRFALVPLKLHEIWEVKLIPRKVIKICATRCHIVKLKCTKFDFSWGSAPDPTGELTSAPPDLLAGSQRAYSLGQLRHGTDRRTDPGIA